jgi:ketosteroid isomerase-like protein
MIEDAAAVVRRHVDAFNARDLDALMAGFTADARWVTGTAVVHGYEELTGLFAAAMAGLLPRLVIEDLLADGDRAYRVRQDLPGGQRGGHLTGNGGCHHHGTSCNSMRSTHLTHQKPRRPGATRRSGKP